MDKFRVCTEIYRSDRRTISVEVKPGRILVRAPRRMSDGEIAVFLQKKKTWIENHLQRMEEREAEAARMGTYSTEELKKLAEMARHAIPQKVEKYAPIVGVDYGRITIRAQRTRWGSCSSAGSLNFNCLLMLLPDEVIDSVVVHELCHRKHMDHSPRFYAEVERVYPAYRRWNKWLNENGGVYLGRLP